MLFVQNAAGRREGPALAGHRQQECPVRSAPGHGPPEPVPHVLVPSGPVRHGPLLPPGPGTGSQEIAVAGAHGGAGTTTLAILLQPAWDLGAVRRPARDRPAVRTGGRPLTLVTRNTATAAARATAAVNAITWQGERVAVLAIVSDGLPAPAAAAYRFRILAPPVGAIICVPFIACLRAADDPAQADLSRKARRSIAELRAAALAGTPGPAPARTR